MPTLSPTAIQLFYQQGYLLIPNVYAKNDMEAARVLFQDAFLEKKFHNVRYDSDTLLTDIYTHFQGIESLVFNQLYISVAKDLLGPSAVLIPECAVHRERYPHWHKDTTVQEMAGVRSHCDQNISPILQFATYFQDNGPNGGGLTVIPGSQHLPDPFLDLYSDHLIKRISNKLLKIARRSVFDQLERHPDKTNIPCCLGDLLVFDLRVFHRATFRGPDQTPDKFAIFNTFINPDRAGMDYFRFMKQRKEPYYQYFREVPLPSVLFQHAKTFGFDLLY